MNSPWRTALLGELAGIEIGRTPTRDVRSYWDPEKQTENVWLSIADLLHATDREVTDSKEYLSDQGAAMVRTVEAGTLLMSFKLTIGRLAFAGRDLRTNEAIAAFTIFDEGDLAKEYLYYYLMGFDWARVTEGGEKVKGITLNKKKMHNVPVSFPDLPQQKQIVAVLDELLDKVATAKAQTAAKLSALEELQRAVLLKALNGEL